MNLDARIKKSTESILQAGLELLTENKDAKLTEVAAHAGVGRATLYRLFKNKEDLVMAITLHCFSEYEKATHSIEREAKSALHAIELLFHYAMPLTLEFQFLTNLDYFIEISTDIKLIEQQHKAEMTELVEHVKREQKVIDKLTTSWLLNYIDGLFFTGWLQQTQESYTAEQAAELAYYCFEKLLVINNRNSAYK